MLDKTQIEYLLNDLILLNIQSNQTINFDISQTDIVFYSQNKSFNYSESHFSFNEDSLSSDDVNFLTEIIKITKDQHTQNVDELSKLSLHFHSLLKLIFYFSHEKYLKKNPPLDKHGRFFIDSIKENEVIYLQIPITDILIRIFLDKLNINIPNEYQINFTCDFDILNHWNGISIDKIKKILIPLVNRKIKIFVKELSSFVLSYFSIKYNYYLNTRMFSDHKDLTNKHNKKFKINNIAFLLLHFENPNFDFRNRNSIATNRFLKKLKQNNVHIGLHPSYNTSNNYKLLYEQMNLFYFIFNEYPKICRFHYLKCIYPEGLKHVSLYGFSEEYSFGFFDSLLFRGGITKRFKQWDFIQEKAINTTIVPLSIMDGTIYDYMNLNIDTNFDEIERKLNLSINYGFEMTFLIHNNGLIDIEHKSYIANQLTQKINDFLFENK